MSIRGKVWYNKRKDFMAPTGSGKELIMELKGSRTERNLREAFAGETQARSKYDYFASVAKKEGYEQIAAIFQATANNEKEHAKMWFKALSGIGSRFPVHMEAQLSPSAATPYLPAARIPAGR